MIDKLKKFFAGLFSITALLYATGYISEVSNGIMLGISSMIEPPRDYYLIAGGELFITTFLAIYTILLTHFFYFIPFFIIIAIIIQYEAYARKVKFTHLPRAFAVLSCTFSIISFILFVPFFAASLFLRDMLLPRSEQVEMVGNNVLLELAKNLKVLIQNADYVSRTKLEATYVMSLLAALISFVMLVSMIRQLDRWRAGDSQDLQGEKKKGFLKWRGFFSKYLHSLPRQVFFFFVILIGIATVVQIMMIPANYGMLVKPNTYPCVVIEMDPGKGMGIMDNYDFGNSKLWLLRQNSSEMLLYGALVKKDSKQTDFKLFTLKKEEVRRMEILENSFVFKYK